MPSADVVVIGAGLAGLTAAIAAAESGARVHVLAKGHAATHWGPGGIDVAGIPAAPTPRDGIRLLAAQPGHPYAFLGEDVAEALDMGSAAPCGRRRRVPRRSRHAAPARPHLHRRDPPGRDPAGRAGRGTLARGRRANA